MLRNLMLPLILFSLTCCATSHSPAVSDQKAEPALAAIETKVGARLGVAAFDLDHQKKTAYRGDEKFLLCSTFKLLLVAQILSRVDRGVEQLDRVIPYQAKDLLSYAPVTTRNLKNGGMSIQDLSKAALQWSDNTAANLLLKTQGGPKGLTEFLRSIGDLTTHLDRNEPALNEQIPGQDLDTSTPNAMAATIEKLFFGKTLSISSRTNLKEWMLQNQTGAHRLKAGLPPAWTIADKTGTGPRGATNDVGVMFRPQGPPIIIVSFLADSATKAEDREAAVSKVAELISK